MTLRQWEALRNAYEKNDREVVDTVLEELFASRQEFRAAPEVRTRDEG